MKASELANKPLSEVRESLGEFFGQFSPAELGEVLAFATSVLARRGAKPEKESVPADFVPEATA